MTDTQSDFSPPKQSKTPPKSKSLHSKAEKENHSKKSVEKKGGKRAKAQKGNQKVPRKKKQSKGKKQQGDSDAKQIVKDYMQKQNRPYNLLNVFDNLHGKIKKPTLEMALNDLADEKVLTCKQFGKNKVYYLNQDSLNVSKESVDDLGHKYTMLRAEEVQHNQRFKKLLEEYKRLMSKKTISQIKQAISMLEQNISILETKKKRLMSEGSIKIDEKEVIMIEKQQTLLRKELTKRKKLTKQLLSTWSEITEKKIAEVAEMMGVQL